MGATFSYTRELMTNTKERKQKQLLKNVKCSEKGLEFVCQRTLTPHFAFYFQSFSLIDILTHVSRALKKNVRTNQNCIIPTVSQSPAFISHLQAISCRLAKSAFWTIHSVEQEQDFFILFFFFSTWERKCSGSISRSYT